MPQPEYVQRGYLREDFRLFHLKGPMEEQLDWHYHTFHKLIFFLGGHVELRARGAELSARGRRRDPGPAGLRPPAGGRAGRAV